ncbi:MAG: hypothetical protein V1777_02000 [Candidatus Micrarchaeota archaeon]
MAFLDNIIKTITGTVRTVVAFMFFVFTAGMLFGLFLSHSSHPEILFVPPILGLLAFYNETIAILILILIVVVFFI